MKRLCLLLNCLAMPLVPALAQAQENDPPGVEDIVAQPLSEEAMAQHMDELETRLKTMEATAVVDQAAAEEAAFAQEMQDLEQSLDGPSKDDLFQFWGFFDLTFGKYFLPKNSSSSLFASDKTSFMITNFNLYFKSQMTKQLSTLGELRFSFLPHGQVKDYAYEIYKKDDAGQWEKTGSSGEYQRVSSEVQDPFTTIYYRQGGLMIERIHLTWEPRDWFKVIAGRFLTPYGIWNIDHGSPVVIPVIIPYIQLREMVPPAQTGLQVYGRLFLGRSDLFFDYAVTVSNGHGPIEQVYDYDDNKAFGLRLHGTYEAPHFKVSLGAYGMFGRYTDQKKTVRFYTNADGNLDTASLDMPFQVAVEPVKEMDEYIVATDLLVELYGLRLQSEYVWTRWDYNKTGPRYSHESLFAGARPGFDFYRASNVGNGIYVLLAYELPLARWLGNFKIMPYAYFERNQHDDTLPHAWITHLIGGFNLKPSPYVTIKLEGGWGGAQLAVYGGDNYLTSAQMAVSF